MLAGPSAPTVAEAHNTDVVEAHDDVAHVLSVPTTTVGVGSAVVVNEKPLRVIVVDEVPAVLGGEAYEISGKKKNLYNWKKGN